MKKKTIIIIIVTVILVVTLLCFLLPRIVLHIAVTNILRKCSEAEFVTDFDIVEKNGIIVDNGYFSFKVPEGYTQRKEDENENLVIYERGEKDIIYAIGKVPEDYIFSAYAEDIADEEIVNKELKELGYVVPDSYYSFYKTMALINNKDYKFWDLDNQRVFFSLVNVKMEMYDTFHISFYEREDIRAIILRHGESKYMVDVMREEDLDIVYKIYVSDAQDQDVWKLLNSLQFH